MTDTGFYRALEIASSFLFLNVLWMVACLPLITFFPATAAMFRVVRHWREHDDYQTLSLFWRSLRENFTTRFLMGLVWFAVVGLIVINYRSIPTMPEVLRLMFYTVNTLVALMFAAMTIYLFPILAHFQLSARLGVKLAFVLSHQQLATTALCLLSVAAVVTVALMIPITLLLTGSVLAYIVFALCSRTFPDSTVFPVQP